MLRSWFITQTTGSDQLPSALPQTYKSGLVDEIRLAILTLLMVSERPLDPCTRVDAGLEHQLEGQFEVARVERRGDASEGSIA